jgi:hypothetical protein
VDNSTSTVVYAQAAGPEPIDSAEQTAGQSQPNGR